MKTLTSKVSAKNSLKAKKASRSNSDYFLSQLDMATIKHDEAIRNSKIKRGEISLKGNNEYIVKCRCGATGCLYHGDFATDFTIDFYRGGKKSSVITKKINK